LPAHALIVAAEALESRMFLATTTLYVDLAATGASTGADWADAFTNLQTALSAAQTDAPTAANPIVIEVAQGPYYPTSGTDRTATFQPEDNVTIEGGFAGAVNPTTPRNVAAYPTILSGDIGMVGNNADNSYHVVTGSYTDATAVLDGFTIIGGNADGTGAFQISGGGMLDSNGSPTITNCAFTDDLAFNGGGVANSFSSPTFTNCTFIGDSASFGGGIENSDSFSSLANCTFINNWADDGGGIGNADSSATLTNCAFIDNSAANGGGGIENLNSSSPTLTNCTFTDNSASDGGAIYNIISSTATLANCILWNDSSYQAGNEINNDASSVSVITYSDVTGGYAGTGNIDVNPLFLRDPFTNGSTDYGNLELQAASPCVNAGSNAALPPGSTMDIAGNARISGGTVDMGAYEFRQSYYVDQNTDGTGIGTDWADAFTNLQTALIAAQADSPTAANPIVIEVAQGTYYPTSGPDRTATFQLEDNVSVEGGFAGAADPTAAQNVSAYSTILSGDIGVLGDDSDNSYHVVTGSGTDATAGLDGVAITGGNANSDITSGIDAGGGGMLNLSGNPTINNCIFTANSADYIGIGGGALYNYNSSPTLTNCDFSDNFSAAISNSYSSPTIANCTFTGNTAGIGGAIDNMNSSPSLTNCTFANNVGYFGGGAMFNINSSNPTLINCSFIGNQVDNYLQGDGGGAIQNNASSPMLVNCTFTGNSVVGNGGAIANSIYSFTTLTNCILWNDSASQGNEIYNDTSGGPATVTITYSDVDQSGYAGSSGNIDADPLFISSANLDLESISPCVDTGSNAAVPSGITTDLAGNSRISNGTVDMGAYEQAPVPPTLSLSGTAQGDAGTPIYLPVSVTNPQASDPGATLSLVVSGVPEDATVSGGTNIGPDTWSVNSADLTHFSITTALDSSSFSVQIAATITEASDNSTASSSPLTVPVTVQDVDPDSYEPDNSISQATVLLNGVAQSHSIDPAGDVDWYTFTVPGYLGASLVLASLNNPAADAQDLEVTLYADPQGTTPLGQMTGNEIRTNLERGQYWLEVQDVSQSGIANYIIYAIANPPPPVTSGIALLVTGNPPASGEGDYYDQYYNGYIDNVQLLPDPSQTSQQTYANPPLYPDNHIPVDQLNPNLSYQDGGPDKWRTIYPYDADWSYFVLPALTPDQIAEGFNAYSVSLLTYDPSNGMTPDSTFIRLFTPGGQVIANDLDPGPLGLPAVESEYAATVPPGTYSVLVFGAGDSATTVVANYYISLQITPAILLVSTPDPTPVITPPGAGTSSNVPYMATTSPLDFTVQFVENGAAVPVFGFGLNNIDLSSSSISGDLMATLSGGSDYSYTIAVTGMSSSGTVVLGLADVGSIFDTEGNPVNQPPSGAEVTFALPVSISAQPIRLTPGAGTSTFQISCGMTLTEPLAVNLTLDSSSTDPAADYTLQTGDSTISGDKFVVTIPAGSSYVDVTLNRIDADDEPLDMQTVTLGVASSSDYQPVVGYASATVYIDGSASPAQLVFADPPSATTAGVPEAPLIVDVENPSGNIVTNDDSIVTLDISTGPPIAAFNVSDPIVTVQAVNGVATFAGIFLNMAGLYALSANDTADSLPAIVSSSFTVGPAAASQLIFADQLMTATAGDTESPITVEVEDPFGNIVANSDTITISVASGPGTALNGTLSVQASNGSVTFSNLSLNQAGTYAFAATDTTQRNVMAATSGAFIVNPAGASQLIFVDQPTTTTAGVTEGAITVDLEDPFGNIAANSDNVTIAVATGPSTTLNGTLTVQASGGVASFSNLSLNVVGTYTLAATDTTDSNVIGVTSGSFTVNPAAASQLVFVNQPITTITGITERAIAVDVEDPFGNIVTTDNSDVTLDINTGPAGALLNGSLAMTTVPAANGIATFASIFLNTAGSYALSARDGSLLAATSSSFVISYSGPQLVFDTYSGSALAGGKLPNIVIETDDANGSLVPTKGVKVKIAISGGGKLQGTTTGVSKGGKIVFKNLSVLTAGSYTFRATATSGYGAGTSGSFVINPATAKKTIFLSQPNTLNIGQAFGLKVELLDQYGNVATNDTSTVALTLGSHPKGSVLSGVLPATVLNGIADIDNLTLNVTGNYTIQAKDGELKATSKKIAVA
jgi:hypothetical protein